MIVNADVYLNKKSDAIGMKKLFLVDDDLDDQDLIIDAIKSITTNINVSTVTNGNKALLHLLALAENELPDLIVLDYNLPELNGRDILEALSKQRRFDAIPKVIWSTSSSGVYEPRCIALGAKAYFIKPSNLSGIHQLAKQMVEFCNAF